MEKQGKRKPLILIPLLKLVMFFLITDNIASIEKFFAHDTSIFSAVNDANISLDKLNKNLHKISEWVYK